MTAERQRISDPGTAGASWFLLKDTAAEELMAAIRTLADGDALLAPGITRRLIREFASRPEPGPYSSPKLELRILQDAATGQPMVRRVSSGPK